MVLPFIVLRRTHDSLVNRVLGIVTVEGMDRVWLRNLREDRQWPACRGCHQSARDCRLRNVQQRGPGRWRNRRLNGQERRGDLTGQIDGAAHLVVSVVHLVAVLVHHADGGGWIQVKERENGRVKMIN